MYDPKKRSHPHEIFLYTSGSKFDNMVKEILRDYNAEFEEIDIRVDHQRKVDLIEVSGQRLTPVAVIDGRVIVGYRPEMFEIVLNPHNEQGEESTASLE